MHDELTFETRLTVAFERLAALAPPMDDAAVAREAIAAGSPRRAWRSSLREWFRPAADDRAGSRPIYLLIALVLLVAALLVAVAVGAFRDPSIRLLGRNGSIAFTVQGNNHVAAGSRVIGADGSDEQPIAAGRCPTYSSDGSVLVSIAYAGTATLEAWDRTGTLKNRRALVDDASTKVSFGLSPDGLSVAWAKTVESGATELWVAPIAGGPAVLLVPESGNPNEIYAVPTWSPDGRQIAYATFVPDPATGLRIRSSLSVIGADGSGLRELSSRPALIDDGLSWSPDGRFITYVGLPDGSTSPTSAPNGPTIPYQPRDLFVIAVDGTGERNLTGTPAFEQLPAWSSDGAFLAFERSADGLAYELVTIRMNGPTTVGPPSVGPTAAWFAWSPDATTVAWVVVASLDSDTYRSTLLSADPEFKQAPATLRVVDGSIVCNPSWQRLDP